MKRQLLALAALLLAATPGLATDVGVSISVGEPGFYGRIDLGDFPPPQLIYRDPLIIQRPIGVLPPPLYLRVPHYHAKHWRKHCHRYNACGQPVYFVQERWYNDVYVPHYRRRHHSGGPGPGPGPGRGYGRD